MLAKHKKARRWLRKKGKSLPELKARSGYLLASAGMAGTLLLSQPKVSQVLAATGVTRELTLLEELGRAEAEMVLKEHLKELLPEKTGELSAEKEEEISAWLYKIYGIRAVAELEGNRLNDQYGWVGYEQHLKRYPGDVLAAHRESLEAGMAPGLGAWRYFTSSQEDLTEELEDYEKYYFAAQTLYLPNWSQDFKRLREWYKYRKMMMINVETGRAVMGVVGDSGPADWTGKQFGASPEAMEYLGLHRGSRKGKVILFFVDDPENKIPLGPVS